MTMRGINAHYNEVANQLVVPGPPRPLPKLPEPIMLVPVPG